MVGIPGPPGPPGPPGLDGNMLSSKKHSSSSSLIRYL